MQNIGIGIQPELRQRLYEKAIKTHTPLCGAFELTPRCNMNCRMCFIRMSEDEMKSVGRERTAKEWIELAKKAKDAGMLILSLTGGEPLIRKDFKEIYTELSKMGFVISMNTNGILITSDIIDLFKQYPPSILHISLYGDNDETYEKLCRYPGGFTKVTKNIDALIEAGIKVGINATLNPMNVECLEGIYGFAKSRNLKVAPEIYMFPPVRNDNRETTVRFTPKQAGEVTYKCHKLGKDDMAFKIHLWKLRKDLEFKPDVMECKAFEGQHLDCVAGRAMFWVTWDGKMTPCGMMNAPVTYPFDKDFNECWKYINEETGKLLLPSACSSCSNRKACTVCGALCMAEGEGDCSKKPEYLCGLTEEYVRLCLETDI